MVQEHYKLLNYRKILSKAIKVAKKLYYDKIMLNSKNKIKTTWNIIKSESGRKVSKESVHLLNMNGNLTKNQQMIANPLNNYFLTTADTIIDNN